MGLGDLTLMKRSLDCLRHLRQDVREPGKNWGRERKKSLGIKENKRSRTCLYKLIIPAVLDLRWEGCTFDASLDYIRVYQHSPPRSESAEMQYRGHHKNFHQVRWRTATVPELRLRK